MRKINNNFALLMILLLVFGCAGTQYESINNRIAIAEVSYQEVLKTAIYYKNLNKLNNSQTERLNTSFTTIDSAFEALYIAKDSGDIDQTTQYLIVINRALVTIRQILQENENE